MSAKFELPIIPKANQAILALACSQMGRVEFPGKKSNGWIVHYLQSVKLWAKSDNVPWCAGFVGWVLTSLGFRGSGSLMARSYLEWGQPVEEGDERPGDIVIFWRKSKKSRSGHVAFFCRFEGRFVHVAGGNQRDSTSVKEKRRDKILAIRRVADFPASLVSVSEEALRALDPDPPSCELYRPPPLHPAGANNPPDPAGARRRRI